MPRTGGKLGEVTKYPTSGGYRAPQGDHQPRCVKDVDLNDHRGQPETLPSEEHLERTDREHDPVIIACNEYRLGWVHRHLFVDRCPGRCRSEREHYGRWKREHDLHLRTLYAMTNRSKHVRREEGDRDFGKFTRFVYTNSSKLLV